MFLKPSALTGVFIYKNEQTMLDKRRLRHEKAQVRRPTVTKLILSLECCPSESVVLHRFIPWSRKYTQTSVELFSSCVPCATRLFDSRDLGYFPEIARRDGGARRGTWYDVAMLVPPTMRQAATLVFRVWLTSRSVTSCPFAE